MSFIHEARFYSKLSDFKVKCETCWHHCHIKQGKYGRCRTRINEHGKLYCVNYGLISTYSNNPIEKKPLFHYYPASVAATIGSYSCNYSCLWCQNSSISKVYPSEVHIKSYLSPKDFVERVNNHPRVTGISISFNEPTLSLEYALDVFNLCPTDVYRMFVTNGYMTKNALNMLIEAGLTGLSVNIKGTADIVKKYCHADVEKVWENIKLAYKKGVHIEVICLVIPSINDSDVFFHETSRKINQIDPNIPLHFTRFFPAYKLTKVPPTPVRCLEKAHSIAKSEGLNYVYLGNVFGHELENTFCPKCAILLIKRTGYSIDKFYDEDDGSCPNCGTVIPIYRGEIP